MKKKRNDFRNNPIGIYRTGSYIEKTLKNSILAQKNFKLACLFDVENKK